MMVRFLLFLMIFSMIACQKDIPEPETKEITVITRLMPEIAHAKGLETKSREPFQVQYFVKGNDVLVECMIANFSFRNNESSKIQTGKMHVYVDGKKNKEVSTAAFIIKNLHRGNHRISLQIVKHNGQKTSLKKEFIITIP